MGIYISDLEIPKDKAVQIVIIRDDGICVDEWGNTYGVVSIPSHGRLIDADTMITSIKRQTGFCKIMGDDLATIAEVIEKGFLQEIENAPTIIPAEEGE